MAVMSPPCRFAPVVETMNGYWQMVQPRTKGNA